MVDLVFSSPPATDGHLVFGELEATAGDTTITVVATIPFVVEVKLGIRIPITVQATIPFAVSVNAEYVSGASRPLVNETGARWQVAVLTSSATRHTHTAALPLHTPVDAAWQQAEKMSSRAAIEQGAAEPHRAGTHTRWQDGLRLRNGAHLVHEDGVRISNATAARWQDGLHRRASIAARWQDGLRDRRNRTAGRWQQAVSKSVQYTEASGNGIPFRQSAGARHQQAMRPPPGIWDHVIVVPPGAVCYTPSPHLVFKDLPGTSHLVFVCDGHGGIGAPGEPQVVVPVKRVYVVLNNVWLRKVEGDVLLPTYGMSLSLDRDSWTWSFSATLPPQALADVSRDGDGNPVEVEASINGTAYRFLVESVRRQRQFGRGEIGISGRGKSAVLDEVTMNFTNVGAMTAQQLMNDVLTENGVSIGWDIDFSLTDWNIPAGAFSHQGTYISALNAIANAAGGYVQPVPVAQVLRILPEYPDAPWNWPVTAHYELPADVMTTESLEWVELPRYNRVYVTGTQGGSMGRVTRAGTDGALEAPMVVDPLLSAEPAQRQRGTAILSKTGPVATMGLRLPVLSETGIIVPGKYVRYLDGGVERFGITRGVRVDVGMPEVFQTIEVQTHG